MSEDSNRLPPGSGEYPDGTTPARYPPRSYPDPNGSEQEVGYGYPAAAGSGGADDWRRYVGILFRRKWLVLAIVLLGTGIGVVLATMTSSVYQADVRLWVDSRGAQSGVEGPIEAGGSLQAYDWVDLLRSYTVLEEVVREQGLVLRPERVSDERALTGFRVGEGLVPGEYQLRLESDGVGYSLWEGDTLLVERGNIGSRVGSEVGFEWTPSRDVVSPGETVRFRVLYPREVARNLGEALQIRMLDRGSFMHLTFQGGEPDRVASVLNAVADRFVEVAATLRTGRTEELEGRLAEQLEAAEERLREAEAELEVFRARHATRPREMMLGGGELGPAQSQYFGLLHERDRLRRDRRSLERILDDGVEGETLAVLLEGVPVVTESPQISGLLQELARNRVERETLSRRYTEAHPDVQAVEEEIRRLEGSTLPAMTRQLTGALSAREGEIEQELSARSSDLAGIPSLTTEEARLVRTAAISSELYTLLKTRHEAVRLAVASAMTDIHVLDRAEPPRFPLTDIRNRIVFFAFALSFAAAVGGVLLFDRVDPRIRYPDELTKGMGLEILGTVPRLKLESRRNGNEMAEEATEAFRGLRLNLVYAFGRAGPLSAAISSPGPGDGKSFVSLNLALSFARIGWRTLLVDGDVRRGRIHRTLHLARRPGLVDHLAGEATRDEIVRETAFENLDVITSGVRRKDAPELLSSPALGELLANARTDYDVVLIDTAPLGVGVDPLVFSALTGNLLLVVRSGSTVKDFAEAKLAHVAHLPVRVLGAVLNAVPPSSGYPNYYYYFPEYAPKEEPALTS